MDSSGRVTPYPQSTALRWLLVAFMSEAAAIVVILTGATLSPTGPTDIENDYGVVTSRMLLVLLKTSTGLSAAALIPALMDWTRFRSRRLQCVTDFAAAVALLGMGILLVCSDWEMTVVASCYLIYTVWLPLFVVVNWSLHAEAAGV